MNQSKSKEPIFNKQLVVPIMRQIFAKLCYNSSAFLQALVFRINAFLFFTTDCTWIRKLQHARDFGSPIFEASLDYTGALYLVLFGWEWFPLPQNGILQALLLHTGFLLLQSSAECWLVCLSLYQEEHHYQQHGKSVEAANIVSVA